MANIDDLLLLMSTLRDPKIGCSWDLKQNFTTLAPYTLEEACEVVEAVERGDFDNLREELGDLLFQIIFYAQIASEKELFDFQSIAHGIVEKLIRRHPHIFPDGTLESAVTAKNSLTPEQVAARWQEIKEEEKAKKGSQRSVSSVLPDNLPASLPALKKAEKIQQAAAMVDFDWETVGQVENKIQEELEEVQEAIFQQEGQERIAEEIGDVLFACVNYARHLNIDAEMALRGATRKFERRFNVMESLMAKENVAFKQLSVMEREALWKKAKHALSNKDNR